MQSLTLLVLACALSSQGEPATQLQDLIDRLGSEKVEIRNAAVDALKELGKVAIPGLEIASTSMDPEIALQAKSLLRTIAIRERLTPRLLKAIPDLENVLVLSDPHTWTLAFLGVVEKVDRENAYSDLRRADFEVLVLSAAKGLRTAEEKTKFCKAIARWNFGVGGEILSGLLDDTDGQVRAEAIRALACTGTTRAVAKIARQLADTDSSVCSAAAEALADFGAKDQVRAIALLLNEEVGNSAGFAALALADLGSTDHIQEILGLLRKRNAFHRWAASTALGNLGVRDAVPELVQLLKDESWVVRKCSIKALGQLGDKSAADLAITLLRDQNSEVRIGALEVLGSLSAGYALPQIEAIAQGADLRERIAALKAIEALGSPEGLSSLEKFLLEKDGEVARQAAVALCNRGARKGARIVAGSTQLSPLNGLRSTDLWKQMKGQMLGELVLGSPEEVLERSSRRCGLTVEWLLPRTESVFTWTNKRFVLSRRHSLREVIDMIEDEGVCSIVVDGSVLRVYSTGEARAYWNDWLQKPH